LGENIKEILTLQYTPPSSDILKFEDLPEQNFRNRWTYFFIYKIINIFSVSQDNFEINVNALFNYLRLFILLYKYLNITADTLSIIPFNNRTIDININLIEVVKKKVNSVFTVSCITKPVEKKQQQTAETALSSPIVRKKEAALSRPIGVSARVAELAEIAAAKRNKKQERYRIGKVQGQGQGGGNTNNHTRRNKNKRKKNSKSKTKTKFKTKSSPKYKKRIPSSRSGSQSNRKKSKPKKSQKNVTFKRRRARK
jgi:hypothetical protein